MHNYFTQLQRSCGLSNSDSAQFLGGSLSSIDKWRRGVSEAPKGIIDELIELDVCLQEAASNIVETVMDLKILNEDSGEAAAIPLVIYPDDATFYKYGRKEGLPFNSTHLTLCDRTASMLRLEEVPVEFISYKKYRQLQKKT